MENSEEVLDTHKQKDPGGRIVWVLVIIIVILLSIIGGFTYSMVKGKIAKPQISPTAVPAQTVVVSKTAVATSNIIVDAGVTWQEPKQLDDLNLFNAPKNNNSGEGYKGATYFEVGSTDDNGKIVVAYVKTSGLGDWYEFHRFIKKDDKYKWIKKNSAEIAGNDDSYTLATGSDRVTIDATTVFKSILPDEKIASKSTELIQQKQSSGNSVFVDSEDKGDKVGETKWGDLYLIGSKAIEESSKTVKVAQYYVKLNDSTKMLYLPTPVFLRDDQTLDLEFTTDTEKANSYKFNLMSTGGCGLGASSFPLTGNEESLAGKKVLGTSSTGAKVYYLGNTESILANYVYGLYKNDEVGDKVSKDEFYANYGVALWKDDYGSTIIYLNQNYAPQVECAKPVVYLYPTEKTTVEVNVGAKITKSIPDYKDGWKVVASPDGKISAGDNIYQYLFWDGLGLGTYPEISTGVIVKKEDVSSKISSQLGYIGLDKKEIADFLDFWLPKMPSSKYVRLTWLTNQEMERLAPLTINPKPNSVIRAFLDFGGLDEEVSIQPQVLPRYSRDGFTVVEWGGLLIKD